MARHSILTLAKQGDPRAIAYLITRTLAQYGIVARANRKGHCIKLLLEGTQVPHQATMAKLISQGMHKLNIAAIRTVELHGRKQGQPQSDWKQVIELSPSLPNAPLKFSDFQTEISDSETPIFQLEDLDPDAMIFVPVEPKVQIDDLDPDAMIFVPLETPPASTSETDDFVPIDFEEPEPRSIEQLLAIKLPRRLTGILLLVLWLWCIGNTLILVYSLLSAGSFSLYTSLDLSNTNQPFANLVAGVVSIADFIFTPLDRFNGLIHAVVCLLSLIWLYHLHKGLKQLFAAYPISPRRAVLSFALPLYNFWGSGVTLFTLANWLETEAQLKTPARNLRRLTIWLYFFLLTLLGLISSHLWLLYSLPNVVTSLWFDVIRDGLVWISSILWLRLVRIIWRSVREVYRTWVVPLLPLKVPPKVNRSRSPFNLSAILLGGGASLLSLALFNFLLGSIAALVFVSNGLPPEAILPTFYDSESLLTLVLVGSFFCIGLGGFITAAIARRARLLHALGLGVLLTLIGIALQQAPWLPASELPFWFETASAALMIPAALIGGGLREWFNAL